jgi:hypothetical protein
LNLGAAIADKALRANSASTESSSINKTRIESLLMSMPKLCGQFVQAIVVHLARMLGAIDCSRNSSRHMVRTKQLNQHEFAVLIWHLNVAHN